jgi:predicted AAA+ superfamily ATPase
VLNALTGNFAPPEGRQDIGALWENYLISERKKLLDYHGFFGKTYFWRNSLQAEIDYVEVIDGKVYGYEFKWNPKAKKRYPKNFIDIYTPELTETIHKDNYMNWLINYPY